MTAQEVKPIVKKKAKAPELEFKLGEIYDPAKAKNLDEELDSQAAVFKARKGQCGSRRTGDGPGAGYDSNEPFEWTNHYDRTWYGPI